MVIICPPSDSILQPLHADYKRDLFTLANDEKTALYSSHWKPVEWEDHCAWFLKRTTDKNFVVMIIAPKGNFLGRVELKRINQIDRNAELAVTMNQQATDKGIGTRAVKEMVRIGFETLNLYKIFLYTSSNNARAIRVFLKAGFHKEATLQQHRWIGNAFYDFDIMSKFRPNAPPLRNSKAC